MTIDRRGNWFYFDEADKERRWAAPVPNAEDGNSSYVYLALLCPSTRDASRKLAAIRKAVKLFPNGNGRYFG